LSADTGEFFSVREKMARRARLLKEYVVEGFSPRSDLTPKHSV
jgi:hypothetical protein